MDIILLERVYNLGQIGDVVKVKAGYARNFLLPHKKALRATEANKAKFEAQRAQIEANNLERRTEAARLGELKQRLAKAEKSLPLTHRQIFHDSLKEASAAQVRAKDQDSLSLAAIKEGVLDANSRLL